MAARYLAKVEYGPEKFSTFFISKIPDWRYNFLTLTDDIKRSITQSINAVHNENKYRDEDSDFVNLLVDNKVSSKKCFSVRERLKTMTTSEFN